MPLDTSNGPAAAVVNAVNKTVTPTSSSRRGSDGEEIVWPLPRDRVTASTVGSVLSGRQGSDLAVVFQPSDGEASDDSEVVWRMTPRPDKTASQTAFHPDGSDSGSSAMYTRKKPPPASPFAARSIDTDDHSLPSAGSGHALDRADKSHPRETNEMPTLRGFSPSAAEAKAAAMHMINTPSYSSVSPSRGEFRPRGNSVLLSDDERETFAAVRLPLETADEQTERIRAKLLTSLEGLKLSKAPSSCVSPTLVSTGPGLLSPPPTSVPQASPPQPSFSVPSVKVTTGNGAESETGSPMPWGLDNDMALAHNDRNTTNLFADGGATSASPTDGAWSPAPNEVSNMSPEPESYANTAERRAAKQRRKDERAAKRAAKEARRAKKEIERNDKRANEPSSPVPTTTTTGAWNVQAQQSIVPSDAYTTPALNEVGQLATAGVAPVKMTLATPAAASSAGGDRGLTGSDRDDRWTSGNQPTTNTITSPADDVTFAVDPPLLAGPHGADSVDSSSPRLTARTGLVMFQTTQDGPGVATRQTSLKLAESSRSGFGAPTAASAELHTRELDVPTGMAPREEASSKSGRRAMVAHAARHATQPREALGKSQLKGYAPSNAKRRLKRRHRRHHRPSDKGQPHEEAHGPSPARKAEAAKEGSQHRHSRRHNNRRRHSLNKAEARNPAAPGQQTSAPPTAAVAKATTTAPPVLVADDAHLKEPFPSQHSPHTPPSLPANGRGGVMKEDDRSGNSRASAPVPRRCTSAAGPSARTPVPPPHARGEGRNGAGEHASSSRRFSAVANLGSTAGSAPDVVPANYTGAHVLTSLYGARSARDGRGRSDSSPASNDLDVPLRPTPPPAVAGSAVAAVQELKHQKELAAVGAGTDGANRNGSAGALIQQVESFSTSDDDASRSHGSSDEREGRSPAKVTAAAGAVISNKVVSSSPAPPHRVAARRRSHSAHKDSYSDSYTESRGSRHDRHSSCSSFGSYTSDPRSGSSYGYSSYTYSSSSSGSELLCEKIPPRPGSRTSPPLLLFTDLQHRHMIAHRMDLRRYAETGVIYEWSIRDGCWDRVETQVVIASEPFSHGNMRASYFMIDLQRLDCKLVAKRYLKSSVEDNQYFDDVSMHSISGHWARLFNAAKPPKEVRFVPAAVLELTERTPPLLLAMEPQLEGTFTKYNNNSGYVPKNARWTPQAFSHFTYHVSGHQLLIVDIQGVSDIYTDPQILSPDGEGYGRGNLGLKGIKRFLSTHKCNSVCAALNLPAIQNRRETHGSESRIEKSDYVLPENLAREQLPPKVYKSTDVQRTRSMNNSQFGGSILTDPLRAPHPPALSHAARPGASANSLVVNGAPGSVPIHDPRFMQHIRNAVSRPKSNYFAPAAGMLPVTTAPPGYPAESSSGKVKSGNSTVLMTPTDCSSHSAVASSANVGAPLTQPAQPMRSNASPAVMPFLRPLANMNSVTSQGNSASPTNNIATSGFQYSPRPGNWMGASPGGYNYGSAAKANPVPGADAPGVPVLSAVEERWPGQVARYPAMRR